MDAKNPVRPAWPAARVISAGLGFAGAIPARGTPACVRPAQRTCLVDGAKLTSGTISPA